jgi:branched-subunit amino acid ABC-type transport system permease component
MKHLKSLLVSIAELGIIIVAATSNILWYLIKRTRLGPVIRSTYFSISNRLGKNKSQ